MCKEVIEKTEQVLEQAEQKEEEDEDELVEEEIEESITQIEEIYQESTDGKTWRTVRKVTTITPQGTSERFEILKGIPPTAFKILFFFGVAESVFGHFLL